VRRRAARGFARIVGLAVRADVRRAGAGATLVRAAEELARGWGCDRVEVTSSRWRTVATRDPMLR
jgi:GNAT superfamily N-acetyltransferase